MKIAIVANGQLDRQLLPDIKQADYIIGVDRAAYWLLEQNVTPHIAVGDFDSTSTAELVTIKRKVKTVQEPAHPKNKTDLEMAVVHSLALKPTHVSLYGAVGSRLDQTISAINLLEQFMQADIHAEICDMHNRGFLLQKIQTIVRSDSYRYFSVLAHTDKASVTIRGARYPLNAYMLHRNVSLGISNEIARKRATIIVHSGTALIIQSHDSAV